MRTSIFCVFVLGFCKIVDKCINQLYNKQGNIICIKMIDIDPKEKKWHVKLIPELLEREKP